MLNNECVKQVLLLAALMTFVTACTEGMRSVVALACGTNQTISAAVQAQVAEEMGTLPSGSIIRNVILPDWLRMRDENRACRARPGG